MVSKPPRVITSQDLPALFQAADQASAEAQRRYNKLVGADLALLVVGAILGAVSVTGSEAKENLAIASAVAIACSLALTVAVRSQRLSSTWYDGRAVAESVKTSAWRYMMQADPYSGSIAPEAVDHTLTEAFRSFLSERKDLSASLGASVATRPQITTEMRAVRSLPLSGRVDTYLGSRIEDQKRWYAKKASANKREGTAFFVLVLTSQALALIGAIFLVRWPEWPVNLVGVFTGLAAGLIAWTQLKRHEELATAYGLAAQELGLIQEQGGYVNNEQQLSAFVLNSENAISREHTLWLARRDHY